jgi:hypothetical protein
VPKELESGDTTRVLMKRIIFYRDELLDMVYPCAVSQERKILTRDVRCQQQPKGAKF